ncbi:MAG TPA: NAD(P)-binding domain-containing protein [Methyloceanibacter sp.]|jgi:cation diffusion facilitator CzcD-associated flavoprotein CzcO|nr:NAD(P)-binding domain-containing protein [Methyloceanibacter sp.]
MDVKSNMDKVCIIGAGSSGLAAAKTFRERGIPFDCLEREHDIGGLWNEATGTGVVYDTAFLVSSRSYTGFEDYPFPEEYPTYPSHRETLAYLRAYAMNFGILDKIEFNTTVERAERAEDGWSVQVAGEERPRFYRALVIANGHHHVPRIPKIPGTFTGEILHSRDYRTVKQLADKRVVVVGSGNSGCDIVVDATSVAQRIYLSMRRGTYFVPKFIFGRPMDGIINFCEYIPLPAGLRNRLYTHWHRLMVGKNERYGLPEPEHRIGDTHPTMNTVVPQLAGHGRIGVKPEIAEFAGNKVRFSDGSEVEADLVVYATGYEIDIPFLDNDLIFGPDRKPLLYLNVFHPELDDLFAVGLIQANGSIWRLADDQSQLVASYLIALAERHERADWLRKLKTQGHASMAKGSYVQSDRHRLEANYYAYRRQLRRHLRHFGPMAKASLKSGRLLASSSTTAPMRSAGTLPARAP